MRSRSSRRSRRGSGNDALALPCRHLRVSSTLRPEVVMPDKADDVRLVERIADGDAEALGELYDRYGRVAFGVLYRMLPGPEAAEEVAQDAFHAVWRRAGSYRPERGAVRTWLLAISLCEYPPQNATSSPSRSGAGTRRARS